MGFVVVDCGFVIIDKRLDYGFVITGDRFGTIHYGFVTIDCGFSPKS